MGNKKLARHVTVGTKTYGPDDDVPADVMEQITNPKAWQPLDDDDRDDEETFSAARRKAGTSSGHRLATTVTVGTRSYGPDDHVPDDVAAQIRNPKAWEGGELPGTSKASASEGEGDQSTKDGDTANRAKGPEGRQAARTDGEEPTTKVTEGESRSAAKPARKAAAPVAERRA